MHSLCKLHYERPKTLIEMDAWMPVNLHWRSEIYSATLALHVNLVARQPVCARKPSAHYGFDVQGNPSQQGARTGG